MSENSNHIAAIVIHGGAGDVPPERVPLKMNGVKNAARAGYEVLMAGGHAIDAVEAACNVMEDDEYLNAGYGSVLNMKGEIEMDASIMNGQTLKAGCVSLVQDIPNPISLAKAVMEKAQTEESPIFLCAHGATNFARENGIEILSPPGQLVTDYAREALKLHIEHLKSQEHLSEEEKESKKFGEVGTVGAVAIDIHGNVAAATTTGGMTGKVPGRIGDTPQIGSGTYADNSVGAVSSTGTGEVIMRQNLAQNIIKRMEWLGMDAQSATEAGVSEMTKKFIGTGGAISIDKNSNVGVHYTSNILPWASYKDHILSFGTWPGEKFEEQNGL